MHSGGISGCLLARPHVTAQKIKRLLDESTGFSEDEPAATFLAGMKMVERFGTQISSR